eukprot:3602079-Pyramimonas_sp.AAC.1
MSPKHGAPSIERPGAIMAAHIRQFAAMAAHIRAWLDGVPFHPAAPRQHQSLTLRREDQMTKRRSAGRPAHQTA